MADKPAVGSITWRDLTVPNAEAVRAFYERVVGWQAEAVAMGGYNDFNMLPPGAKEAVAGVCHARGVNADVPPQWLMYITVADVDTSIVRCQELGGKLLAGPRSLGGGKFCVIEDPAGAVCALYQP